MLDNPDDFSIVRALVQLGHDLKIKVVAEGVETERQSRALEQMGADLLQGYHFSAPVPALQIDRFLARGGVAQCWSDWHPRAMSA